MSIRSSATSPGRSARLAVVLVMVLVAVTSVWLGIGNRDDGGADGGDGQGSSSVPRAGTPTGGGSEKLAPRTARAAPAGGVILPTGSQQTSGYPTGFPYTDLGAVAVQVELARAQIGFDYDQSAAVARLYADPEDQAVLEERSRDAVLLRRQQAAMPTNGEIPPPASYAVTPVAYSLEELDTDYHAVSLLSYITLTTTAGTSHDGLYAGTQLVRWVANPASDLAGNEGDWKVVQGSRADIRKLLDKGQPRAVAPDTPQFERAGWILLDTAHTASGQQSASAARLPGLRQQAAMTGDLATPRVVASGMKRGCHRPDDRCDRSFDMKAEVGRGSEVVSNLPAPPDMPGVGRCGLLDVVCSDRTGGALLGFPDFPDIPGLPGFIPGLGDIPNPMDELGGIIAKAAADAWTAAMLSIWNSGLFVLRIVLTFSELFLTPDLGADGPGHDVYGFTLWLALALVVILTVIQLGVATFKREGKGLARALVGTGQFVVVCATWFGYCAMMVTACGAITRALMKALLKVNTWPQWEPLDGLGSQDIADATVATVLAFLGIFLWIAAIGHMLVYLARAASLLVLAATGPVAAAGLVSDFARAWFWKSLRWFHAAAFTPVLMVMVLGIGVQMSNGVAAHLADDTQKSIGTALPAVMLILISVVAPLALFKLLAFVDPGTPSGASFRQGMAVQGGVQGLLSGGGGRGGSSAASSADSSGRSTGEQNAESSTGDRFSKSAQGLSGGLGTAGQAVAAGMGIINSAGAKATSLMADEANQAGVGQHTYGPDFSATRSGNNRQSNSQHGHGNHQHVDRNEPGGGSHDEGGGPGGSPSGSGGPGDTQGDEASSGPLLTTHSVSTVNLPLVGQKQSASGASAGSGGGRSTPKPPAGGVGGGGAAVGAAVPPVA